MKNFIATLVFTLILGAISMPAESSNLPTRNDSNEWSAALTRGRLKFQQKNYSAAETEFELSLKAASSDMQKGVSQYEIAKCIQVKAANWANDDRKAIATYEKAAELLSSLEAGDELATITCSDVLVTLAVLHRNMASYGSAKLVLKRAIEIDKKAGEAGKVRLARDYFYLSQAIWLSGDLWEYRKPSVAFDPAWLNPPTTEEIAELPDTRQRHNEAQIGMYCGLFERNLSKFYKHGYAYSLSRESEEQLERDPVVIFVTMSKTKGLLSSRILEKSRVPGANKAAFQALTELNSYGVCLQGENTRCRKELENIRCLRGCVHYH